MTTTASWLQLTDGKQYSRLLYPNPVCFLCTSVVTTTTDATAAAANIDNVMVLSWLTATNNHGSFVFSINRRRFTAQRIVHTDHDESEEFVLCVPVAGMEELVRNVGSTSGRNGNKFPNKASSSAEQEVTRHMSKRQRKKLSKFPHGVPGLHRVPVPHSTTDSKIQLFAIAGTCAKMVCRVVRVHEILDDEHVLVVGHVQAAWVHVDYWNVQHNQFYPQSAGIPPYLTFFGAQRFGFVLPAFEHNEATIGVEEKTSNVS